MNAAERAEAVAQPGPRPKGGGTAVAGLIAVFVIGAASFVYALASEASRLDFPLLTVTFLYLMGISQAGVTFSAIMRLVGAQWSKPYYRLGELATLAFFPFAMLGFLLIYTYAREELFYWLSPGADEHLSPWLNIDWLLIRNIFGLLLFYGLSAVYVLKALRPDLPGQAKPDHRTVERELRSMSSYVLLAFVVCNTLLSWDFGMMLIEHWHSTVFPIHFFFGNVFAGCAALILFPAVLGRSSMDSPFGPDQVRNLGMLITAYTLLWMYFYWAQFFVIWFGNLPHESDPLWRQMYGHYAAYYWTMMSACFFIPFVASIFAVVKRSLLLMSILALVINAGVWLNKYLMVVPVFSPDDRPFDSWLDASVALGLLAGFLAVLVLLARRLPVYSYWEMNLKPEPRR
ncbi:MAG: hypothetical protein ACREVN_03005 [Gammaproteobacteria bacterium]